MTTTSALTNAALAANTSVGSSASRSNSGGSNVNTAGSSSGDSFLMALAGAWGNSLDNEANTIAADASQLSSNGSTSDNPSAITNITAESLRFSFLTQSSNTSITSIGQGLDTMARKS